MADAEPQEHYRTQSDSELHDVKQKKQVDLLLEFLQSSRNYCVCVVDIVNSTQATMHLDHEKTAKYYGIFLNWMAETAGRFGAVVVKNVGDSLLYYFPSTDSGTLEAFRNVMECNIAMIDARSSLNESMRRESLPDVSYRISCEYGQVAIAKVSTSSVHDIFGATVNLCSRINALAPPNQIIIGSGFFERVKGMADWEFTRIENAPGLSASQVPYLVNRKKR